MELYSYEHHFTSQRSIIVYHGARSLPGTLYQEGARHGVIRAHCVMRNAAAQLAQDKKLNV